MRGHSTNILFQRRFFERAVRPILEIGSCIATFSAAGPGHVLEFRRHRLLGGAARLLSDEAASMLIGAVFANLIADLLYAAVNPWVGGSDEWRDSRARYWAISRIAKRVEESLRNARSRV